MNFTKLSTISLFAVCLTACGGDDSGSETNADTNNDAPGDGDSGTAGDGDGDGDGDETGPSNDVTCAAFCVAFLEICAANGLSDEFMTDAECDPACQMWDQDGVNCRYEQIGAGACDQAGNNGTACN